MPRVVTSLATGHSAARDKENIAPYTSARQPAPTGRERRDRVIETDKRREPVASSSSSSSRLKSASAPRILKRRSDVSNYDDGDDYELSRDVPRAAISSASKRSRDTASPRGQPAKERNGSGSSSARSGHRMLRTQSRIGEPAGDDEEDDDDAQAVQYDAAIRERDEVQRQFDDMRRLRFTEPERILSEWKKAAEEHNRTSDEYIAKLKRQVEKLEGDRGMRRSDNRDRHENEEATTLQQALRESERREAKLQDELERLQRQLKARQDARDASDDGAATSRLAMRAQVGSGALGAGDERAVRRLYEDLTGLVVNKVEEAADSSSKNNGRGDRDALRRFHAIFACAGYHDLEIKLEESTSSLPSTMGERSASQRRQDFVYTPVFDKERDAELLQSGRLPEYLRESIRFERSTAVKFLNTLHKRLDRHAKR